jgi:bacterioferritin
MGIMDKTEFVDLLNGDLSTEYRSIVQYTQHIATIKGAKYQALVEEMRRHVGQELTHAMTLADQIDFLGGVPTMDVPPIAVDIDEDAALQADLALETNQLQRYRDRVTQAGNMGLPDVAEALKPMLMQTQDHVMELQMALGQ